MGRKGRRIRDVNNRNIYILKITLKNKINTGNIPCNDFNLTVKGSLGPRGPFSGFLIQIIVIVIINIIINSKPGRIPAMKSLPIETLTIIPYIINPKLGGIKEQILAAAHIAAVDIPISYL